MITNLRNNGSAKARTMEYEGKLFEGINDNR